MRRVIKTALATAIVATSANVYAAEPVNVTPTERAKIEEVVHQYLLSKPEVIVEAMQAFQRKQYEEAEKTVKQTQQNATRFANALFQQKTDPIVGNPTGTISIVEFFDYQCPHCIDMAPVIANIIKANPNVKIIFKEWAIRGPISDLAARAALAANKQGKYYELSHALLSLNQPLTEAIIFQTAKEKNLDVEKLKKDMNDPSVTNQLKETFKLAQDLKLFGTPAFFIAKSDVANNKGTVVYIPGQLNQQQLQSEIDKIAK